MNDFARRRPGWELPIHQLMVKNGVTVFFQGHDHIFARQELDGVVYQTVPEPGNPSYGSMFRDAYVAGDILPNSGRVRVMVSAEKVKVEYVRSFLAKDEGKGHKDGEVGFSYEIMEKQSSIGKSPTK